MHTQHLVGVRIANLDLAGVGCALLDVDSHFPHLLGARFVNLYLAGCSSVITNPWSWTSADAVILYNSVD